MMYLFIDDKDIENVLAPFAGLTQQVLSLSFHRAMRRTENTVLAQTRRLLQQKLGLRNQKRLRSRTKSYVRPHSSNMAEMKFWFGMNDLPPDVFKGKPKKVAGGLVFRGSYYDQAFATSVRGRLLYMKRETDKRYPITKLEVPIPDDVVVDIEDEVLARMPDIFLHHLATDLAGRTRSNVWKEFWRDKSGNLDNAASNINSPARKPPRGS